MRDDDHAAFEVLHGERQRFAKPLGVGILTTAEKKGILKDEHKRLAALQMMQLNKVGEALGKISGVTAMTDVTGFGLLGHLTEMAEGSNVSAVINMKNIPLITPDLNFYLEQKSIPGGTNRNWESYGHKIGDITDQQKNILADPQTSGGLLIAADPSAAEDVIEVLKQFELDKFTTPIGQLIQQEEKAVKVME